MSDFRLDIPESDSTAKSKNHYIQLLRESGFNCFPIPPKVKEADKRYKAIRTERDQIILNEENYGYIPIDGAQTAIIDLDIKERYRQFAETIINDGFMVIETGKGWHIPITHIQGSISKVELFDYSISDKKVIEIQGPKHYCVGPESNIDHKELGKNITYHNVGTDKIWAIKNTEFHDFITQLCKKLKVVGIKKPNRSSYKNFRARFLQNLPPSKGTSNDYFFQAAIQCNNDGLTQFEAIEAIQKIYNLWSVTPAYSHRPWINIEQKIQEVYENDEKIAAGRPKKNSNDINRTEIATQLLGERDFYSNVDTEELFENNAGFLELINNSLRRELQSRFPEIEKHDYTSIIFKMVGSANELPPTNKDFIVFKNGVYSKKENKIIETTEIADLGFRKYNYLERSPENEPKEFMRILFENTIPEEYPRIKAGLKKIFHCYVDPRISVLHGEPGVGKSTVFLILVEVLGDQYAMSVELDQLLGDHFIRAHINGKILLVLQDLPQTWKDFAQIKTLTGEQKKTERGFQQDSITIDNRLKIWGTTNYLTKIPQKEKNAMYRRRLSLVHNTRKLPYPENSELYVNIISNEAEKIVSWMLNLTDEECQYEDGDTVKKEWESLASPEIDYFRKNWYLTDAASDVSVVQLIKDFEKKSGITVDIKQMTESLEAEGCVIKWSLIKNISQLIDRGLG